MSEPKAHPKKLRLSKETLRRLETGPTQFATTATTAIDSLMTICFICPTTPDP